MKIRFPAYLAILLCLLCLFLAAGCALPTPLMSSSPEETIKPMSEVPIITALEAYNLIQKNTGNTGFIILDVRTPEEYNSGHIAGAINIDYYSPEFEPNIRKLDKDKQYLVYCRTGIRAAGAVRIMLDLGFNQVQNLSGGIVEWIQDGYPTVK